MNISNSYPDDSRVPVKRYRLDPIGKVLTEAPTTKLFIKGPIPLDWVEKAAGLPGKTLHLAMALWWLQGMTQGKPFKVTRKAEEKLHVSKDAGYDALKRLEQARLISVERKRGQRPIITILKC